MRPSLFALPTRRASSPWAPWPSSTRRLAAITNAGACERSSVMIRSIAPGLIAVVWAGQALAGGPDGSLGQLIAEGEQRWKSSPDPRDPVACATCHHDPDETRGWAASFPKYR